MENKEWLIVSYKDKHGDFIINDVRKNLNTTRGNYSSIGIGYDTKEELIEKEKVLDCDCKKCGNIISTNFHSPYNTSLVEHKLCFGCLFWHRIYEKQIDKKYVIIDGESYHITPDDNDAYFKGHGGREFKIKRFDSDEIITTKNL